MKCPKCRHEFDFREAGVEADWYKIIAMRDVFGQQHNLVWEYVFQFGVTPLAIRTKKLARLLEEVGALFAHKKFRYRQRTYTVSEAGIKEGLTVVCNRHFESPLENHNYLKKVLVAISEREQKEQRDQADQEQRRKENIGHIGPRGLILPGEEREECLSREEVARLAGQVVRNLDSR